ncbi:MAG: transposase [Gemmatimonadota bacterium]
MECQRVRGPSRTRCARAGVLAYLAAWDVRSAQLVGRCEPTSGIVSFDALVADVDGPRPVATATRVFWIVHNGSSHRGQAAVTRLATRWPNLILVHLPIHACWLNQIEILFSIVQRKVLHPFTREKPVRLLARLTPAASRSRSQA